MTNTLTARTAPAWATAWTRIAIEALPVDITTATPPQVDEMLRTVGLDQASLFGRAGQAIVTIRKALGQVASEHREGRGRDRHTVTVWPTTDVEAEDAARALDPATPSQEHMAGFYGRPATVGDAVAALDTLRATNREMTAQLDEGRAEFQRRGGWTRYYRVNASNGHVHTSTACRNTYATTLWQWPTNLSGADGDQVVEFAGSLTCLTCFPGQREDILADRPVRFDMFETPEQRDERQRREQAAADLLAAKVAKGVTPDGKPLAIKVTDRGFTNTIEIKTERAAELRIVEFSVAAQATRRSDEERAHMAEVRDEIIAALAWKRGMTAEQITEAMAPKVARKIKSLPSWAQ
jgi:hypothetical protein